MYFLYIIEFSLLPALCSLLSCSTLFDLSSASSLQISIQSVSVCFLNFIIPMRMKKSSFNTFSSSSCASPSCSSSSPPSSISSSSSITTNSISLASSTDSSSSFSPYSSNLVTRCQGLDLLVKAIHLVTAGSVVGVPYIQRRVVRRRRRRRALEFNALILNQFLVLEKGESPVELKKLGSTKARSMSKRQKRGMALPSKYQDSVLHPLKPKNSRNRSTKIDAEMGS